MKIEAPKYHRGGQCPIDVEAMQYDGTNGSKIELWLGFHCMTSVCAVLRTGGSVPSDYMLDIPGVGRAKAGNYVVKNLDGSVVILEAFYFEKEFKKIEPNFVADGALVFLKKFATGHRIVSTGDLTLGQIAEASKEGRLYIEPDGGLGWAALPWELTTSKDRERETEHFNRVDK